MTTSINTNGISVGTDGKVNMSGLTSSIDWKSIVDAQIKAKRLPAVNLEKKMTANATKITAYSELKAKTLAVTTALDKLRGVSGFSSTDVFKTKTASGTTAAAAGAPGSHVPSDIANLITASIAQTAATGSHTIKVQQIAKADQVRSDLQTSNNVALGLNGTFKLNDKDITVSASDTLLDIRSKINSAGAGVNATIVSSNASSHYLVLTGTSTGAANALDFDGGNALTDALGLTDTVNIPSGAAKNSLVTAQNAIIDVDGITGIERDSNEIDDVLEGVTLQLVKGEPNTEITLKVEGDLNSVKTAIVDLVKAYNDLRAFATAQRTASDRNEDGTVDDNEVGPLAYDNTMRQVLAQLGNLAVSSKSDNADGFRSLSQMGITLNADYNLQIDDTTLDNRLITNVDAVRKMFAYDATTSDSRLSGLGRTADTAAGTYYVNIGGTDVDGKLLYANIQTAAGVNIGGLDDGSVKVEGNVLTVLTGPAKGLSLYFSADPNMGPTPNLRVDVSRGAADQFYDYFNATTSAATGTLDTLGTQLATENTDYTSRIKTIDERLVFMRSTLESKFIAMERALAQMENLKKTLTSYFDASNKS